MKAKVKRRLTSILCADVQSYARLMESDEAGTLETLRRYRSAMQALIDRHDGRVVNTWGDALIAEFSSVVEAVQCAIEIQRELAGRNRALPEPQQMWFRVGINLGDVMVENDNIYGEGVNIAARLQELAEPGGIIISGPVYDQVRSKLAISFGYLGQQPVKNVAEPVSSYRVLLDRDPLVDPIPAADPGAEGRRAAEHGSGSQRPGHQAGLGVWARLDALPRPVRVVSALIVFLFAINLFSGLGTIWFHWPAAIGLLFIFLYLSLRRPKTRS
jgi:adenylate cyclase